MASTSAGGVKNAPCCFRSLACMTPSNTRPSNSGVTRAMQVAMQRNIDPVDQIGERIAPELHGKVESVPPLHRVGFEQPAVEERDVTECAREAGSLAGRAIERAEKQRIEQVAGRITARQQAAIKRVREESRVAREPPLRLDEPQEQQPGDLRQDPRVASGRVDRARQHSRCRGRATVE